MPANSQKEKEIIIEEIRKAEKKIEEAKLKICLDGKYDKGAAVISIQAGTGGMDAEDWARMLLRVYQEWAKKKNFKWQIIYQQNGEGVGPEGRVGLKEVTIEIKGKYAYGLLKKESGVHRLVRISPFSARKLRHTSFVGIEVIPLLGISTEIKIKPDEVKIETFKSSGPGGQNVNKRESAVRVIHLPTGIRVSSQVERLQGLNRQKAMEILKSKLLKIEEKKKDIETKKIKGERQRIDFANQIRSYVFHPYRLIKDHRTKIEETNINKVLNGELDKFIEAEILWREK